MTGIERPRVRTLASPLEMREALRRAWRDQVDHGPSRESLCVLLAQWALETGRSARDGEQLTEVDPRGKACWCWNLGNIKYPGPPVELGERGDWFWNRCNEIILGKVVWFDKPNRAACFQAFATLNDGCVAYLSLLRRRYSACGAWGTIDAGTPAEFAKALKRGGYYTADEASYTRAVVSLFREYLALPDPSTICLGSRGPAVAWWQSIVGVTDDGVFGRVTDSATRQWQVGHRLVPDGIVGPITWGAALCG